MSRISHTGLDPSNHNKALTGCYFSDFMQKTSTINNTLARLQSNLFYALSCFQP